MGTAMLRGWITARVASRFLVIEPTGMPAGLDSSTEILWYPGPEALQAYGQGRLPPEACRALEEHLAGCEGCCDLLEQAPGDSFLGRLRAAGSVTPADPGRDTATFAGATAAFAGSIAFWAVGIASVAGFTCG